MCFFLILTDGFVVVVVEVRKRGGVGFGVNYKNHVNYSVTDKCGLRVTAKEYIQGLCSRTVRVRIIHHS